MYEQMNLRPDGEAGTYGGNKMSERRKRSSGAGGRAAREWKPLAVRPWTKASSCVMKGLAYGAHGAQCEPFLYCWHAWGDQPVDLDDFLLISSSCVKLWRVVSTSLMSSGPFYQSFFLYSYLKLLHTVKYHLTSSWSSTLLRKALYQRKLNWIKSP